MCNHRGQSEVVGILLLIGVVVVLVGVAGTLVLSNAFGGEDRRDLVSVDSNLTADTVTIEHAGGKSYNASTIDVVLKGESTDRITLSAFDNTSGDRFSVGTEWTTAVNLSSGDVRLFVIHRPSGTVVHEDVYFVGSQPSIRINRPDRRTRSPRRPPRVATRRVRSAIHREPSDRRSRS